jgi:hypothetical protein
MALPLPRLKHTPRRCSVCGDKYNRRNLVESWTTQNQGHRAGWMKTEMRVCTRCSAEPQARRLVIVAASARRQP